MRRVWPICRPAVMFLAGTLLPAMMLAGEAYGQFSRTWSVPEVQIGQHANLFARWDSRTALDGLLVEVPPGWTVHAALALRHGYEQIPLEVQPQEEGGAYVLHTPSTLRDGCEIIVQVTTGGLPGRAVWAITPLTQRSGREHSRLEARAAFRHEQVVRQVTPILAQDNRVLAFRGDGPPVLLRQTGVPDLGTRAAYTVEFWMRTTDLNEVVLSTWTGEEETPYPLEFVVDAGGRLRYYRGQPGQHEAMATRMPVADGQWHHIALTHDPDAGWTRLFLDGTAADSLFSPVMPAIDQRTALAVGARVPARSGTSTAPGYTGLLDELRLWSRVRRPAAIRRTMRQPMKDAGAGGLMLGFDTEIPRSLVERDASRAERIYSDLAFYQAVHDIEAVLEGDMVVLTWRTTDSHTRTFVVERSRDGQHFEAIGEVEAGAAPVASARDLFTFHDSEAIEGVVFYRIRQRFESGAERLSGAIKLGLGRPEPQDIDLIGNFPNPFNPSTTITYEVHEEQRVRLSVWDLAGQQVSMMVNQVQPPGTYQVAFEGHDLPSGTYFVRLETRTGMQAHKMVLMK